MFRILGPLEVSCDQGSLRLSSRRQRVVLAMLLLQANRLVTIDRLVDAVWGDRPPDTARGQIYICVSRLRQALERSEHGDAISTASPGYVLHVDDADLDLHAFERLASASKDAGRTGRTREAVEHLRAALDLWRGEPLAGIDSEPIKASRIHLTERRMRMVEERIGYELDLNREHELVDELSALTAEFPLHERLWGQLMTVFSRLGRRSDALDAYQRARKALVNELGVEPGVELRRLQRTILTGGNETRAGAGRVVERRTPARPTNSLPPVPRLLPPRLPDFAGREATLTMLTEQLSSGCGGDTPPTVAISGMAGIGKTALATETAHRVSSHFPDGQLYAQLNGTHAHEAVDEKRILAFFLRTLGVSRDDIPATYFQCVETFRNLTAHRRILIVIDGVMNEQQIMSCLPSGQGCALLVTSRTRLAGLPSVRHVRLDALRTPESVAMLTGIIPERARAEPSQVLALARLCDGLPLALRAAASRLAARPHWSIGRLVERLKDSDSRLAELVYGSHDVRASIELSYRSLDASAQRLFRRLAHLKTPDFPAWVSAPLLDCEMGMAHDALDTLVDAQLIDAHDGRSECPRYRVTSLVHAYARECLTLEETVEDGEAALRRMLSCWLLLVSEAHHRQFGTDYTTMEAPLYTLPEPLISKIVGRPLEWFEREKDALMGAVDQASELGTDDVRWDVAQASLTGFLGGRA